MLKLFRNKELKKKFIWAVAILIILSFGFFGTAYLITGKGNPDIAGKIFRQTVSRSDFLDAYRNVEIQSLMQYGDKFHELKPYLNLESRTWDRLILLHEANKRKIKVYDDMVIKSIQENQNFHRNGHFDSIMYEQVLKYLRVNPRDFEEGIRENLKMQLLYDQATRDVHVSADEIAAEYQQRNQKVQVSYVLVEPDKYKNEDMYDEAGARAHYEANPPAFMIPAAINVEYVLLPFPDKEPEELDMKLSVDNEPADDIDDPLAGEGDDDFAAQQAVRDRADEIYTETLINPNLREVAEANSLEIKETGFFNIDQPDMSLGWPFEMFQDVFRLTTDTIPEPFETPNGMVLVNVTERRDAYIPDYEEVKNKVKDSYLLEKAREVAKEKTREAREKITAAFAESPAADFAQLAKDLGLNLYQSPDFSRGQYLPIIGISKEFENAAFDLTKEAPISEVIDQTKGFAILYLDNKTPADPEKLPEQRAAIEEALLQERKNQTFTEFMTILRVESNLDNNLARRQAEQQARQSTSQ